MKLLKNFFGHLKTVIKHRWFVFLHCCYAGIPLQGLIHDLSKFNPIEFFEGVKYYQGDKSPINACKEANGYSMAWFHHKGRNKHHFEYWIDCMDDGGKSIQMPYKYALELICDFLGAGKAYNGKNFTYRNELDWWLTRLTSKPNMLINEQTKLFITMMMFDFVTSNLDGMTPNKRKKKLKYILRVRTKELYKSTYETVESDTWKNKDKNTKRLYVQQEYKIKVDNRGEV